MKHEVNIMTLYDLLSTLKTNAKVYVTNGDDTFTVYADSIKALDESIQGQLVSEWEIAGGQTIKVTLEHVVSG